MNFTPLLIKALFLRALDILANKSPEKKKRCFFGHCVVSQQVLKKEIRQCFSVKQGSMQLCAVFDFYDLCASAVFNSDDVS